MPSSASAYPRDVPGTVRPDHAVVLDPGAATAQAWLRRTLDPVQLDYTGLDDEVLPRPVGPARCR